MSESITGPIYQAVCKIEEYKKPECPKTELSKVCYGKYYQTKKDIVTVTDVFVQSSASENLTAMCQVKVNAPAGAKIFAGNIKTIYQQ